MKKITLFIVLVSTFSSCKKDENITTIDSTNLLPFSFFEITCSKKYIAYFDNNNTGYMIDNVPAGTPAINSISKYTISYKIKGTDSCFMFGSSKVGFKIVDLTSIKKL